MRRRGAHFTDKKGKARRGAKPGNTHTAQGPRIGRRRQDLPPKTKPAGAPKGPPRGKPFEPGANSHTGEVFRRGEDDLPRGNVTLMFKCILHDEREALYRAIVRKLRRDGDYALHFLEKAGNRIEGLPVKKVEPRQGNYGAVFVLAGQEGAPPAPPRLLVGASASPAASELSAEDALILLLGQNGGRGEEGAAVERLRIEPAGLGSGEDPTETLDPPRLGLLAPERP